LENIMVARKRKTAGEGHELDAALDQLREDLETLKKDVGSIAGEAGSAATDRLNAALAAAMSSVESITARVEGWSEENLDSVREAVRDQPLQSCMIAFGIGALIGAILRR
jgi:ElaB/YqjD/DUF883 family membrane-anchored ribosome-binding protein